MSLAAHGALSARLARNNAAHAVRNCRCPCSAILQNGLTEESRNRYYSFLKNKNRSKTVEKVCDVEYLPFQYQQDYLLVKEASRTSLVESIQNFLNVTEKQGGFQAAPEDDALAMSQRAQAHNGSRAAPSPAPTPTLTPMPTPTPPPQPQPQPQPVKIIGLEQLSDAWSEALHQLLTKGQVIVSTRKLSPEEAQRAIDFISGAAAVIGATCHEVNEGCYHFATFSK